MKQSDVILKREQVHIRFKNEEMDFMFNWVLGFGEIIGLSHGEIFYASLRDQRRGSRRLA